MSHLIKNPGGDKPFGWIGADLFYARINFIWTLFSIRENMTRDATQINSLIAQLDRAPYTANHLFLAATLSEHYAYLVARKLLGASSVEEKRALIIARINLSVDAVRKCHYCRHFKYLAGALSDYARLSNNTTIRLAAEKIFDEYYCLKEIPTTTSASQNAFDYINQKFGSHEKYKEMFQFLGVGKIPSYKKDPDFAVKLIDVLKLRGLLKSDEHKGADTFLRDAFISSYRVLQKEKSNRKFINNISMPTPERNIFADPFISLHYNPVQTCLFLRHMTSNGIEPRLHSFLVVNIVFFLVLKGDQFISRISPNRAFATEKEIEEVVGIIKNLPLSESQFQPHRETLKTGALTSLTSQVINEKIKSEILPEQVIAKPFGDQFVHRLL